MRACAVAVVVFLCLSVIPAVAQRTGSTAVVISDAPIFLEPDSRRTPLRVAARGTTLVIDKDGTEWILVTFKDPQFGLRQGYIQAKFVQRENLLEPIDLSVPGTKQTPTPASVSPQRVDTLAEQRGTQAQRPPNTLPTGQPGRPMMPRSGFWFSGGLGYGTLTCQGCENSYLGGFSGGLAAGVTVNQHFLIGGGTTGWSRTIDGVNLTAGTFDFRVRAYPSKYHGFFVNGGIGVGTVSLDVGDLAVSDTGLGIMFGTGWDIKVGRNVSVTPFWNGSGISAFDEAWGFGQIGVGITIH